MQQNPPAQIQQQLATLTHTTWQQQLEIIQALPVTPQIVKLISHRNYSSDLASLLASQNPRSKLVTTLTEYLLKLFELYTNQLLSFANLLITSDCLLRLLGSGNKVVASSANELIKCIVSNTNFKDKHKQIKYVKAMEDEFLKSKNNYVREKISLYFTFIVSSFHYTNKEDIRYFQAKIVKNGLEDPCEKVRKNMKQILQNLVHFQKENVVSQLITTKQVEKQSVKNINPRQQGPRVVFSSVKYDSLLNYQRQQVQLQDSKVQLSSQRQPLPCQLNLNDFQFYLDRLNPKNAWSMIILAFESLLLMINNNALGIFNSENLFIETLSKLIPFLGEKRGKIYQSCSDTFCKLLGEIRQSKKQKFTIFVQQHVQDIVQQTVKLEQVAAKVLPQLMAINPTFFLVKMAEISTHLKTQKEKLTLLDNVLQNIPSITTCTHTNKNPKKVAAITRMMCHHISTTSNREKDISLASLAIISELKSTFPEDVLTTLLCQSDKTLTKIIQIAQSIDESLKTAVVGYINSLKGNNRSEKSFRTKQSRSLNEKLNIEMQMVIEQKVQNITKIGQLYLANIESIGQKEFKQLFGLLEYLPNSDMIMEYQFLLGEITKNNNPEFVLALIDTISQRQTQNQYFLLMFMQVLTDAVQQMNNSLSEESGSIRQKCCICLTEIYRNAHSIKIRNKAIQGLTCFESETLQQHLNEKELLLTKVYRQKLEDSIQDISQVSF